MEELSQYNMILEHRAGIKHTNADALSRMPAESGHCDGYTSGLPREQLPCGGCEYCMRAERQWGDFIREVDDAVPLVLSTYPTAAGIGQVVSDCGKDGVGPRSFAGGWGREAASPRFVTRDGQSSISPGAFAGVVGQDLEKPRSFAGGWGREAASPRSVTRDGQTSISPGAFAGVAGQALGEAKGIVGTDGVGLAAIRPRSVTMEDVGRDAEEPSAMLDDTWQSKVHYGKNTGQEYTVEQEVEEKLQLDDLVMPWEYGGLLEGGRGVSHLDIAVEDGELVVLSCGVSKDDDEVVIGKPCCWGYSLEDLRKAPEGRR